MPSLFADVDYYKRAAKEGRQKLASMGIQTKSSVSELVISEDSELYSWVFPDYDLVKDKFRPIIEKLNQEIRERSVSYTEYRKLETLNLKVDSAIQQGFSSRLKRTPKEDDKTGKEYETFVSASVAENAEQVKRHEELAVYLDSQIKEAREVIAKIDKKGFVSKRLHKEEFASQKKKSYERINALNDLKRKNEIELDTAKMSLSYYTNAAETLKKANVLPKTACDYVNFYLFLNKNLHSAKYYADKANELEQAINKLSAKERFEISLLLQEHYLAHKPTCNYDDIYYSEEYNYLDLHYMIYSLAEGAAKEGLPEAKKFVEETLMQVSVEKDESRMMSAELHREVKCNLSIIHALSFCGNKIAADMLKDILAFRNPKLSQISAMTYDSYVNDFDVFEERKSKIVKDIVAAAEEKRKQIEEERRREELAKTITIIDDPKIPEVEIVYVPNVEGM